MSRVSLIEQLYAPKRKSALEFNYDNLWAPPIRFFLSQQDIDELYKIATSLKYNDNIEKKYELIDAVMKPRGFKRGNCGTNRVVYNFLEDTSFCMKIALDRVGIHDSPKEFKNQEFFKPFCCKIFEVDPTGVIACIERVNPISSLEEFISISDDVFNMMITKIIGKYVVDDLGTEKFMNYGIRYNSNGVSFGPVILDYPYAYELDGAKLHCTKPIKVGDNEFICGGEIDYDAGLNNLVCSKCGRHYSARELAKDDSNVLKFYSDDEQCRMRARIIRESDGTIVKETGRSSKLYMTKEEYEEGIKLFELKDLGPRPVVKTYKNKYTPMKEVRLQYHTELQLKAYEDMQKRNAEPFNPVIKSGYEPTPAKRAKEVIKMESAKEVIESKDTESVNLDYKIPRVRPAVRAEELLDCGTVIEEIKNSDESTKNIVIDSIPGVEESTVEGDNSTEEPLDEFRDDETKVIKDFKFDSVALMQDGSVEPKLSDVVYEDCKDDLNTAIVEAIQEAANEDAFNTEDEVLDIPSNDSTEPIDYTTQDDNGKRVYVNGNYCMGVDESDCEPPEDDQYYDDGSESFTDEMEADVFPEILNQGITIGSSLDEEIDYSNYIPADDTDDDYHIYEGMDNGNYSEYYEEDRKEQKRSKKQNSKNKKYDDMSDY